VSDIQQDDELHDNHFLKSAVTKPAVGFFDLASNLSEGTPSFVLCVSLCCLRYHPPKGVRNTTTVFDRPARERVRLVSGLGRSVDRISYES
jgi:hypothetical protein